jgi:hypothetical protein
MTEQKLRRRHVYVSDEEWAALKAEARARDVTISAVIRHQVDILRRVQPRVEKTMARLRTEADVPAPITTTEQVARTDAFIDSALAMPRPVPKPVRRKR